MTTLLVRLKPYDPRRGHVLQRYTYAGIKFHETRGWYRVEPHVADYLRSVHQRPADLHTPLAFDVCTDAEAKALELRDKEAATPRKTATDDIPISAARIDGAMATTPRRPSVDEEAVPASPLASPSSPGPSTPIPSLRGDKPAATAGPAESGKEDRKPAQAPDTAEPARDDRRPAAPAGAARRDRT